MLDDYGNTTFSDKYCQLLHFSSTYVIFPRFCSDFSSTRSKSYSLFFFLFGVFLTLPLRFTCFTAYLIRFIVVCLPLLSQSLQRQYQVKWNKWLVSFAFSFVLMNYNSCFRVVYPLLYWTIDNWQFSWRLQNSPLLFTKP